MPRTPRVDYAGAIQHVAVNGNNRQPMFLDARDRYLCLILLGQTAERYGWDVLSYCLMDTHWHVLVRTPERNLSAGMQRMNTCYSQGFNRRHGRSGHSIRHRFMSVAVEDEAHLFELTRYLPLNPVHGGLIRHPEGLDLVELSLGARPRPGTDLAARPLVGGAARLARAPA